MQTAPQTNARIWFLYFIFFYFRIAKRAQFRIRQLSCKLWKIWQITTEAALLLTFTSVNCNGHKIIADYEPKNVYFHFSSCKTQPTMEKRTLKFDCLINLALFARSLGSGYLMNTSNFTLTGKFSDDDIQRAKDTYNAIPITTTEKVFSYEQL